MKSVLCILAVALCMSSVLAFSGRATNALNVRSDASSHSHIIGVFGNGATVDIDCQVNGENIQGSQGTTNVWYHVPSRRGYVSAAWVAGGPNAPRCGNTPVPTGDCSAGLNNPRSCSGAVAWAESHISTSYNAEYRYKCDHVVGLAYGRSASGFESAIVHWNTTPARFRHAGDRNPPAGALVFFTTGQYGHVAISTGGNNLISTDINGAGTLTRSTISQVESQWRAPYLGWTAPYFHNA